MDEDEWFFNSFKRYKELQMFDFPKIVNQIDLTYSKNLCLAMNDDGNNHNEILIFCLPSKLVPNSHQTAKFDRHLSFDHGYITKSQLIQMKCLSKTENLIISEETGVALYDVDCKESDMMKKISNIPCIVKNARMALNTDKYVAFCGFSSDIRPIVNLESMNTILNIQEKSKSNLVLPLFSSLNVVSFGDTVSGSVQSYDLRNGKLIYTITVPEILQRSETKCNKWLFNSIFDIRQDISKEFDFYQFSTSGNILVYDLRNPSDPVVHAKHCLDIENTPFVNNTQLNVSPLDTKRFTICGFDQNVYVCELNGNVIEVIFNHDGHSYNEDSFEPSVRSMCSMWLPFISPHTIISCGSNSSVQCWQYKIS